MNTYVGRRSGKYYIIRARGVPASGIEVAEKLTNQHNQTTGWRLLPSLNNNYQIWYRASMLSNDTPIRLTATDDQSAFDEYKTHMKTHWGIIITEYQFQRTNK